MRYIQSPPNHRGPRILLAAVLSVGFHAAVVGLAGVQSAAPLSPAETEPLAGGNVEPGGFESPIVDLSTPEVPLPEVSVVEIPPPAVEVAVEEEPPPLMTAPSDFSEPTPTPARKVTIAPAPSAPRTTSPATRSNAIPPGKPGTGSPSVAPGSGATGSARWVTPKPPYPVLSRTARQTGSGSVRIQTDATGRVISAEMVQPITPPLDAATTNFARGHWSGPANRTVVVPVTFRLE